MNKFIEIKVNTILNSLKFKKDSNPINNPKIEYTKAPSLPKDFFETVIECEVKLKEKFNIKIFQKLADYYSAAIEYYESINDPKFMVYNQNLGLLFSNPEAKKYLSGGKTKEKLKKEKIKKKIEKCDKKQNNKKAQNIIKRNGTVDTKKVINNLINKDMDIQHNDFKRRLAEKKKRYQLSISDNVTNNDIGKAFKNIGINSIGINSNNESVDFISDKDLKLNDKDKDVSNLNSYTTNSLTDKNSNNVENSSSNNIQIVLNSNNSNNNILDELKNEEQKIVEQENSSGNIVNENSFEIKLDSISEKTIKNKNIKYTNKTMFLEKMKFNFEIYSNDYYDYFIKKVTDQIIKDYNNNFNELTQTLTDLAVNSFNQEKELEYLITSDSDDIYKNEIITIIQQLKEEEKTSKEKIIAENGEKIEKINDKYIGPLNIFQSVHNIEMFKENLKLDTTKFLNTLVFK
jgi:hypothetical protein